MKMKLRTIGTGLALAGFLFFAATIETWVNLALSLI